MSTPNGVDVQVVENTDNTIHITLPAAPDNTDSLSDADLESVAGGTEFSLVNCPAPQTTNFRCS